MKNFDPAQWAVLLTAFTGALAGLGTLISSIRNGGKVDANTKITQDAHAETTAKISELSTKVEGQANANPPVANVVIVDPGSHGSGSAS